MKIAQPIPKTKMNGNPSQSSPQRKRRLARRRKQRIRKGIYGLKNNTSPKGVDSSNGCEDLQEFKFDDNNHAVSSLCRSCQKSRECAKEEADGGNPQRQPPDSIFTEGKLVSGGDWMYLSAVLQYTGPNGVHFCPFCLVKPKDLRRGCPHAPITLERYRQRDVRSEKTFPPRTLNSMHNQAVKFAQSGQPQSKVSNFQNCEKLPLIQGEGSVLKHVSVMPLHLSLGIGLCLVNVASDLAKSIDRQIRNDSGLCSDVIAEALEHRDSLLEERQHIEHIKTELNTISTSLTSIEHRIGSIQEEHPEFLACDGKKLSNQGPEAVDGHKKLRQLKKERQSTDIKRKSLDKSSKHVRTARLD